MSERHPYSLLGIDGNAFSIMGYTIKAMKQCGYSNDAIDLYKSECMESTYDELLSLSLRMVDNCNKLSGYDDPFQWLMKGHDRLNYVDAGYCGVTNPVEHLIDESALPLSDEFDQHNQTIDDEEKEKEDDNYENSEDYYELYNRLCSNIKNVLNNQISYHNEFTKGQVRKMLIGDKKDPGNITYGILDDPDFWEDIEFEYKVPKYSSLNEAIESAAVVRGALKNRLNRVLISLLDDGVKFSKYDVYHALVQLTISGKIFQNLLKYVPD